MSLLGCFMIMYECHLVKQIDSSTEFCFPNTGDIIASDVDFMQCNHLKLSVPKYAGK